MTERPEKESARLEPSAQHYTLHDISPQRCSRQVTHFSPSELRMFLRMMLHGEKQRLRKLQEPHAKIFWAIEREIALIDDEIEQWRASK